MIMIGVALNIQSLKKVAQVMPNVIKWHYFAGKLASESDRHLVKKELNKMPQKVSI